MNEKLTTYLKDHQTELMEGWKQGLQASWNSRIISNSMSGNRGSIRMTSLNASGTSKTDEMFFLLVERYYRDLLQFLTDPKDITYLSEEFPHYSPYGIRLTLGSILELLLTGEESLSKHFLEEVNAQFPGMRGIEAFNEITDALRKIFQAYSQKFCNECTSPLVRAIHHLADQGKTKKLERDHDYGYPYSV